jgi:S-adenosylmethionine:tRNA ribosyltransferase-isomerase
MKSKLTLTSSYDYELPKELIAKHPANPADSAKLLVYDRKNDTIIDTTFKDIMKYIPQNTKVILNDTKVIKARIFGKKESGGKCELFFNKPVDIDKFSVLIRAKVKLGTKLIFENSLQAIVVELIRDGSRVVEFYKDDKKLTFDELVEILNSIGHIPLPPYMEREDEKDDEKDYQTLFAKNYGAVAAPTASLHFTPELFSEFCDRYSVDYITLHVGAGTFKPVEAEDIDSHLMHSEYYEIADKTKEIIDSNDNILAVGTTVTRTIEYYAREKKQIGESNLFLNPLNKPIRVNHLLTNFHLPKSTLIMLVASFVGLDKTKELYSHAVKNNYRFFSYGDAMLII